MQCCISQTLILTLAVGEPHFSGGKGHDRPQQIPVPSLGLSLKANGAVWLRHT